MQFAKQVSNSLISRVNVEPRGNKYPVFLLYLIQMKMWFDEQIMIPKQSASMRFVWVFDMETFERYTDEL